MTNVALPLAKIRPRRLGSKVKRKAKNLGRVESLISGYYCWVIP